MKLDKSDYLLIWIAIIGLISIFYMLGYIIAYSFLQILK